jgi:hypothetical protein
MIQTKNRPQIDLRLHGPFAHDLAAARPPLTELPAWLRELRALRGKIFYNDGQRPSFQTADGAFDDPDPTDTSAFHIVGGSEGRAIGCARLLPSILPDSWLDSVLGRRRLDTILRNLGVNRSQACEGSRWAVAPEGRGTLGPVIVAATWAVARWLRCSVGLVLACTCRNQDVALIRMGGHPVPGVPLMRSPVSEDYLRLIYFDAMNSPETMRKHLDRAAALLGIGETAIGVR